MARSFPPKVCIYFCWDDCKSQQKLKTILMQNFGGKKPLLAEKFSFTDLNLKPRNADLIQSSIYSIQSVTVFIQLFIHSFIFFQSFKGSFLKHNKTTLSRLSSLTSNTPNASGTTRGFVFQTVSPQGKTTSNAKVGTTGAKQFSFL